MLQLIDTHTHFDLEVFDPDRVQLAQQAYQAGVRALVLIGFVGRRFGELLACHQRLSTFNDVPKSLLAPGLHPFYIAEHQPQDLLDLEALLQQQQCCALGEIGLDSYLAAHKTVPIRQQQAILFAQQLELARHYQKPVLLHIRKSHAEAIAMLKQHRFAYGGIAHAFSGGLEEAKALIKLGFKIGVTGQISNPNAKRLRAVVAALSVQDLVIETDCPDMTPICCQVATQQTTRNTPVNLPWVLDALSQLLQQSPQCLAEQLWKNSMQALDLGSL